MDGWFLAVEMRMHRWCLAICGISRWRTSGTARLRRVFDHCIAGAGRSLPAISVQDVIGVRPASQRMLHRGTRVVPVPIRTLGDAYKQVIGPPPHNRSSLDRTRSDRATAPFHNVVRDSAITLPSTGPWKLSM